VISPEQTRHNFITLDTPTTTNLCIHYRQAGTGTPPLVLVHGSFLSLFSWRDIFAPLSAQRQVLAFDRPPFGRSERPLPAADDTGTIYSPEAQADLIITLLDRFDIAQAVLVGHSAGGTACMLAALRQPARVAGLVLISPMVYSGYAVVEFPAVLRNALTRIAPVGAFQMSIVIPLVYTKLLRSFWHDPARLSPDVVAAYRRILLRDNWARALWAMTTASHALHLARDLHRLTMPTLVISGAQDRIVPTGESIRLADELPNATLRLLPACGHIPHEEQPQAVVEAMSW
jgi:pimeloyl-ACP methyl ester carboxylesterase